MACMHACMHGRDLHSSNLLRIQHSQHLKEMIDYVSNWQCSCSQVVGLQTKCKSMNMLAHHAQPP